MPSIHSNHRICNWYLRGACLCSFIFNVRSHTGQDKILIWKTCANDFSAIAFVIGWPTICATIRCDIKYAFLITLTRCLIVYTFYWLSIFVYKRCHDSIYMPCASRAPTSSNKHSLRNQNEKGNSSSSSSSYECHIKHTLAMQTQCEKWAFAFTAIAHQPNMLVSYLKPKQLVYFINTLQCTLFSHILSVRSPQCVQFVFYIWKIAQIQMRYVVRISNDNNITNKPKLCIHIKRRKKREATESWTIKILYRIHNIQQSNECGQGKARKRDNLYLNV